MPSSCFTCRPTAIKALDLASPGTIRAVARRFGVRFERKWGQNFLADRHYLDRLVSELDLVAGDRVLEIGPGLGVLTRELALRTSSVAGIEIDPACVRALELTLQGLANVRIIQADVLKLAPGEVMGRPYRVVGNIAYNLTGPLLVQLLADPAAPDRIDLLLQREVAERLASPPGAWSLATLAVRVYGEPELELTVPREAFYPVPRVASSLLRIAPQPDPAIPRGDLADFFTMARAFFQARRKQLPYALARGLGLTGAEAKERLRVIGIDPARRAETLTLDEWRRLFDSERGNWIRSRSSSRSA
jgi:16S rRNA (adenine1518-N6/adenine1519-N6)-dimethyltransferase